MAGGSAFIRYISTVRMKPLLKPVVGSLVKSIENNCTFVWSDFNLYIIHVGKPRYLNSDFVVFIPSDG